MSDVLGHDSALVRLYWAGNNLSTFGCKIQSGSHLENCKTQNISIMASFCNFCRQTIQTSLGVLFFVQVKICIWCHD